MEDNCNLAQIQDTLNRYRQTVQQIDANNQWLKDDYDEKKRLASYQVEYNGKKYDCRDRECQSGACPTRDGKWATICSKCWCQGKKRYINCRPGSGSKALDKRDGCDNYDSNGRIEVDPPQLQSYPPFELNYFCQQCLQELNVITDAENVSLENINQAMDCVANISQDTGSPDPLPIEDPVTSIEKHNAEKRRKTILTFFIIGVGVMVIIGVIMGIIMAI